MSKLLKALEEAEKQKKIPPKSKPLESFSVSIETPPDSEVPDYLKKDAQESTPISISSTEPTPESGSIFDFKVPEIGWLSSDKLRVISYLVFKTTSRQRISEIAQDLAKVFLATALPEDSKRIAQEFLQYLAKREEELRAKSKLVSPT
jgi:hypothetical protein